MFQFLQKQNNQNTRPINFNLLINHLLNSQAFNSQIKFPNFKFHGQRNLEHPLSFQDPYPINRSRGSRQLRLPPNARQEPS